MTSLPTTTIKVHPRNGKPYTTTAALFKGFVVQKERRPKNPGKKKIVVTPFA